MKSGCAQDAWIEGSPGKPGLLFCECCTHKTDATHCVCPRTGEWRSPNIAPVLKVQIQEIGPVLPPCLNTGAFRAYPNTRYITVLTFRNKKCRSFFGAKAATMVMKPAKKPRTRYFIAQRPPARYFPQAQPTS